MKAERRGKPAGLKGRHKEPGINRLNCTINIDNYIKLDIITFEGSDYSATGCGLKEETGLMAKTQRESSDVMGIFAVAASTITGTTFGIAQLMVSYL